MSPDDPVLLTRRDADRINRALQFLERQPKNTPEFFNHDPNIGHREQWSVFKLASPGYRGMPNSPAVMANLVYLSQSDFTTWRNAQNGLSPGDGGGDLRQQTIRFDFGSGFYPTGKLVMCRYNSGRWWATSPGHDFVGISQTALGPSGMYGVNSTTCKLSLIGAGSNQYMLSIFGIPTGGSFVLNVGSQTVTVPYNWTQSQSQTALQALPNTVTASTLVAVGSGPLPTSVLALQITFSQSETNPTVSIASNSLTGGVTPAPTLTSNWGYLGMDITLVNRSQSIDTAAGDFMEAEDSGTEFNPVWVDC